MGPWIYAGQQGSLTVLGCTAPCLCCPQVAVNLPGGTFFASKEMILGRITAILAAYRKYCATSSSAVSGHAPPRQQRGSGLQAWQHHVLTPCRMHLMSGIARTVKKAWHVCSPPMLFWLLATRLLSPLARVSVDGLFPPPPGS